MPTVASLLSLALTSNESCRPSLSNILPPHTHPRLQHQQEFPGNLLATLAREAGSLTVHLHSSHFSFKSSQVSSVAAHLLQLPPSLCPHRQQITQIFFNLPPQSYCYPSPQLQKALSLGTHQPSFTEKQVGQQSRQMIFSSLPSPFSRSKPSGSSQDPYQTTCGLSLLSDPVHRE